MNEAVGASFAAQPVEKFLEKIARERDSAIARIRDEAREAGRALRRQTRREARLVLRAESARARAQAQTERMRLISGLQARHRQSQWRELRSWVQGGAEAVMGELRSRWADRSRQWEWTEFWLRAAVARAGDQPLQVACSAETSATTMQRIESFLAARPARSTLSRDPLLDHGVTIEWGPYLLDGTLGAQREAVENALLSRLARVCHEAC